MRWMILFLCCLHNLSYAQLAAYVDPQNQFVIFDEGDFTTVEVQPPLEVKVSSSYVAYISNNQDFKVYDDGEVITLEKNRISRFDCTDDLIVYRLADQVYIYRDGEKRLISVTAPNYSVNDSLVAFYDGYNRQLIAYLNGRLVGLADGILNDPIQQFKTGSDIVAFVESATQDFKVYWDHSFFTLSRFVQQVNFKAGAGTVAYIDPLTNEFKVFYEGYTEILEPFPPQSYQVGNGIVAYVTDNGTFKVFEQGDQLELQSFAPEQYKVREDIVVFASLDEIFHVHWHGETYELAGFIPSEYHVGDGMVVFINQQQQVEGFYRGEPLVFTNDIAREVNIQGQSVVIRLAANRVKIYLGDEEFERTYVIR